MIGQYDLFTRPFMRLRILCSMEASGVIRRRMRDAGHDAWSCDLRPARDESEFHFHCDVFDIISQPWDMAIFHWDCTFLTVSAEWAYKDGPYHQKVKPGTPVGAERRQARVDSIAGWKRLHAAAKHIRGQVWENPVGAMSRWRKPTQTVQPYEFGDDASKRTCLWMENLPALQIDPAKRFPGRIVNGVERWSNQTDSGQNRLSPSADRWSERSDTYPGIADAIVDQLPKYLY